jgi:HK97 family phage prohead protease
MPWHVEKRGDEWCVIKDDDDSSEGCSETEEKAKAHMRALYSAENRSASAERPPIENRAATVSGVETEKREIEVLAAPYNQEAFVDVRGEVWRETIARGAFDGVELRANRIKVYRDHDPHDGRVKTGLIGKTLSLSPERQEGLFGVVKIAETALGDDTLALAKAGVLGVSVGIGVRSRDQVIDRANRRRRVEKAFLDHIAFPDEGAYEGAGVLAVRRAINLPERETPLLDDVVAWREKRREAR